jgi:hypothetical protein
MRYRQASQRLTAYHRALVAHFIKHAAQPASQRTKGER